MESQLDMTTSSLTRLSRSALHTPEARAPAWSWRRFAGVGREGLVHVLVKNDHAENRLAWLEVLGFVSVVARWARAGHQCHLPPLARPVPGAPGGASMASMTTPQMLVAGVFLFLMMLIAFYAVLVSGRH